MQPILQAVAVLSGSADFPQLHGIVRLTQLRSGVLVTAEVSHLPTDRSPFDIFAFHIHDGTSCAGDGTFPQADGHYNPTGSAHPAHAGDMPPLFGNHGYAFLSFLTDRFALEDVIGRVIIIHRDPDDFTSQPAGNAGTPIACGKIVAV